MSAPGGKADSPELRRCEGAVSLGRCVLGLMARVREIAYGLEIVLWQRHKKSEEDHTTNLIYVEIFKIGVDPLSEATVVKTEAATAGTREPSARRIEVD
jgi:hypothetical protein